MKPPRDTAVNRDSLRRLLVRLAKEEAGQDLVEYALVALALGLTSIAGVHGLASSIVADFGLIVTRFQAAVS